MYNACHYKNVIIVFEQIAIGTDNVYKINHLYDKCVAYLLVTYIM